MVFQQFNLFPHLTVLENLTLAPVLVRKRPKAEVERQALELLELRELCQLGDELLVRDGVRRTDTPLLQVQAAISLSLY